MPSLKALEEFKTSFHDIGEEVSSLAKQNIPFDDLALPDYEPAASPFGPAVPQARKKVSGLDIPDLDDLDDFGDLTGLSGDVLGDALGDIIDSPPADMGAGGDFDFGGFPDNMPDDLIAPGESSFPDIPEFPADSALGEDIPKGEDVLSPDVPDDTLKKAAPVETVPPETAGDDFGLPPDLLDGFADEIEAERADSDGGEPEAPVDLSDTDLLDLDNFSVPDSDNGEGMDLSVDAMDLSPEGGEQAPDNMDLSLGDEEPAANADFAPELENPDTEISDGGGFPLFSEDSAVSSEEVPFDDFSADDLPTLEPVDLSGSSETAVDMPEMDMSMENALPLEEVEGSPAENENMNFSIPGMESVDTGASSENGLDEMDFSLPETEESFDMGGEVSGSPLEDMPADSFDTFKLDGDTMAANFGLPGDEEQDSGLGDDFAKLEEFSLAGIDDTFGGDLPGTKAAKGAAGGEAPVEEVEEIQLSSEELDSFQKTLTSYPLNLRIACEELIAEQAVAPDLMSKLIKLLIQGASAKETAALAGKILGRTISIPKGFEKKTGAALEAEQASFAYIFVHNFLPVLRLFLIIALVGVSLSYLIYQFIYTPLRANSIYKIGYERIESGEYARANERFREAFSIHPVKDWFYRYAEAFRDARQYINAEKKYDELLYYYPRDKKAVLDYAAMETYYRYNYKKADDLLRRNILDYSVYDKEALLALGDNNLAWGEIEKSRYEDAREAYALLLERYGWTDPVLERMMKYFIRTDNLKEVLPLQGYFMGSSKRKISPASLAELGGYLLDKRFEETPGVPSEYKEQVEGIRDILLAAIKANSSLPESFYHLARYYNYFGNFQDERLTLETAVKVFDNAPEESAHRVNYRIETQRRYAQILTNAREFFSAEAELIKGINLYKDALARQILTESSEFGKLYADLGDLAYFTQGGDMELALQYYLESEKLGWTPPEMLYRMGSAYYQQRQWGPALERFFTAAAALPLNRRILYALGNVSYMRGNYFAAQGYYSRLLNLLETERSRFPLLSPNDRPEHMELAERLMVSQNNLGVTLEALAERPENSNYRARALGLYAESARAWDALTRNPDTMIRMRPVPNLLAPPNISQAYLNSMNTLHPEPDYEPQIFVRIDKDVMEPSPWENLVRFDTSLSNVRLPNTP
jgi:tetratricopeptide (TPR) repeat protein